MTASTVAKQFAKTFPGINGVEVIFGANVNEADSIHLGNIAEGGTLMLKDDTAPGGEFECPAADYYQEFGLHSENFGVAAPIAEFLKERGFYLEWMNAGQVTAYRN